MMKVLPLNSESRIHGWVLAIWQCLQYHNVHILLSYSYWILHEYQQNKSQPSFHLNLCSSQGSFLHVITEVPGNEIENLWCVKMTLATKIARDLGF